MSEIIDSNAAESDLLACATFLAEKIKSSDGHAEAIKEVIPYYLAKDDVDISAELADSVADPFVRDQLLSAIAEKCAEIDDDEYALQLVDAIEDSSFQGVALENIAKQKAAKKQFEQAFAIADDLEHGSNAYAEIAAHQDTAAALQTIGKIEFPYTKVHALQGLAHRTNDLHFLEKATEIAREIELEEEKISAYLEISFQYIEANQRDKAIEVLDQSRQFAETLDSIRRDSFLSQISQGFMRAGSLDLADRTLDLVGDKYEIAHALVGYSDEFQKNGEEDEGLEALVEAYEILKSQRDIETRNSKAKFNLLGVIAIRFTNFGKFERAIEIALENPYDEIRNNSLAQISQICILEDKDELAHQAIEAIDDDAEKTFALMALSDVRRRKEQPEEALNQMNEAYHHVGTIQQLSMKTLVLNRLARRFQILKQDETARNLCTESLHVLSGILDESHRVSALANLADTFQALKFELNETEKGILRTMVRKVSW